VDHPPNLPHRCALDAIDRTGSLDPELVAIEARRIADGRGPTGIAVERAALRRFDRPAPALARYDSLLSGLARERAGQRAGGGAVDRGQLPRPAPAYSGWAREAGSAHSPSLLGDPAFMPRGFSANGAPQAGS